MDNLMMGDQESINIRPCPFCRKPIINTNRYKDLVNNMFKNEINPIKERIYGTNEQIKEKMKELIANVTSFYERLQNSKGHPLLNTLRDFMDFLEKQKKVYLLQVNTLTIYFNIYEMVAECCNEFRKTATTFLVEQFEKYVTVILKVINIDPASKNTIKISEQQQNDIKNEIKRLNAIVQLEKVIKTSKSFKKDPAIMAQIDASFKVVFTIYMFDEDEALKALQKITNTVFVKYEREMIVKAVGLKAGHWYKCPNGHFYCIGECGGAMEESKCPDCGAAIGGVSHRLRSDNAHASEIDGSRYAAYSEQANNMANFIIDF